MEIDEYQEYVRLGASPAYDKQLALIGLVGEVGELADAIKKGHIYPEWGGADQDKVLDEAGDVLWQLANLLNQYGISIKETIAHNVRKLDGRHGRGKTAKDGGKR